MLFGPTAPPPPRSVLLSLERWQAALSSAAQIRLHPGDESWVSQRSESRDVLVRCGRDNLNECLRDPPRAAVDRLAARLAANLTSGTRPRRGAALHLHAFQPFPQIPKYEADGRTPMWSATAPKIAGLTYYSTNPLFRRGDVVPVPLGVRDRHSDNILVASDGTLFHIDFGHILDDAVTLDTGSFATTRDFKAVLEAAGRWDDFVEMCARAFAALRKHYAMLRETATTMLASIAPAEKIREVLHRSLLADERDERRARELVRAMVESGPTSIKTLAKNTVRSGSR